MGFPIDLKDKNGAAIQDDDVIFDGDDYYRIYWNTGIQEVEAISCRKGYKHNFTPQALLSFERIGPFKEHQQLFICD